MPNPHLLFATVCFNRYDLLSQLLLSVKLSELQPDEVMVVNNGTKFIVKEISNDHCPVNLSCVKPGRNIGCAAAWNRALYAAKDLLVLSNDDVEIFPDTLSRLVKAAEQNPTENLFIPEPGAGCAFTFCMMRRRLLDIVGPFDENFWPEYYEDCDYVYRMKLAGVHSEFIVKGCNYTHVGSASLKGMTDEQKQQHHKNFRTNQHYYSQKWGGPPLAEQYKSPFNLDDFRRNA